MKKAEQLFYLIKSMTKSEKRWFKMQARMNSSGTENNYTILFDVLDKMSKYDNKVLLDRVRHKVNTKNVSTLKNQLTEMILKSLRQYSSVNNPEHAVNTNLDYIDVLYTKGLYDQAMELIVKTKKMALELDHYIGFDRLSAIEYLIIQAKSDKGLIDAFLTGTHEMAREARRKNEIIAEFEYLSMKMRALLIENGGTYGGFDVNRLEEAVKHPLLNAPSDELPVVCQIDYFSIWGHYHYMKGNSQDTYLNRKKALELIEKHQGRSHVWVTQARYLLLGLSVFNMKDEFEKELKRILEVDNDESYFFDFELKLTLLGIRTHLELLYGNYSKAMMYIGDLEQLIEENDAFVDVNQRMTVYSNNVTARIGMGDYKKALHQLNEVLNNTEMKQIRVDTQCYNKIKYICIHYSLGNYSLVESLTFSASRFFKKHGRENKLITLFFKFSKKYLSQPFSEVKKSKFDTAFEEMKEVALNDKKSQISAEYFDLIGWIESVRMGCTMDELKKEKVEA